MTTGNAEINILIIILFVLLVYHDKISMREKNKHRFLYRVLYFIMISLATDTIILYITNLGLFETTSIYNFLIIVNFVSMAISAYYWLIYIHNEVHQVNHCSTNKSILYSLPLIFWATLVLSSPFNHCVFFVDKTNQYTTGPFYFLKDIIIYGYILISALIAFAKYQKEKLHENQKPCLNLFIYSIILLLGKGIEMLFPWFQFAIFTIVISIVTLFLNKLKKEIFLDPLTQLYNRRQFHQCLVKNTKCIKEGKMFLVFFDINDFKIINDAFGHVEGDEALIIVSNVLKSVFSDSKAFLARYGGDEFAVILSKKEEKDILSYLKKVDYSLYEISKDLPYNLSLSMGYSIYGEDDATTIESLVQAADKKMYCNKHDKKNNLC